MSSSRGLSHWKQGCVKHESKGAKQAEIVISSMGKKDITRMHLTKKGICFDLVTKSMAWGGSHQSPVETCRLIQFVLVKGLVVMVWN